MSKYTYFWNNRTPLSNWYPSKFTCDGVDFCCGEQYMMYSKAMLFGDTDTAKEIMNTSTPSEHKELGRQVRGFNQFIWDERKVPIMEHGLYHKFTQNAYCKQALLSTIGTELVEANPYDKIWGVGLSISDPRILTEETWLGQNLLGKVLDSVRDKILSEIPEEVTVNG